MWLLLILLLQGICTSYLKVASSTLASGCRFCNRPIKIWVLSFNFFLLFFFSPLFFFFFLPLCLSAHLHSWPSTHGQSYHSEHMLLCLIGRPQGSRTTLSRVLFFVHQRNRKKQWDACQAAARLMLEGLDVPFYASIATISDHRFDVYFLC